MASLYANSTGNFLTAATWSLVDATSFLDSETNTTASTTTFVSSAAFTPGAITIDGIAVKINTRSASPTGTFSVRLHDGTIAVVGTTVTVNVSDLPLTNTSAQLGWTFFKFSAPVLLIVATNYTVQISSSSSAQVTLYRNSTAGNWSRALRTTTTQAPVAADNLIISGEYISAASSNSFTVTMDETATTSYGTLQVCTQSTLNWGTTASTNYYLKQAGNCSIYSGGTVQMGTSGIPVPSTSTAQWEFACTTNVEFGIEIRAGGTLKSGGTVITNSAFLAADASIAATSLTTNVSTGWLSGDVIALASTTRTRTDCESKALTANAAGTTLTITALASAHSGTSPTRAELINLTRNVKIFGTSTTNQSYLDFNALSTGDLQSTEFYNLGSATANKRGFDVATNVNGSFTINNCSIHDLIANGSYALNINSASNDNITCTNMVFYNTETGHLNVSGTTGTNNTYNNLIGIFSGGVGMNFSDQGGTITTITAVGSTGVGIQLQELGTAAFGTNNTLTAHSNTTAGIAFVNYTGFANNPLSMVSTLSAWRNNTSGVTINNVFNLIIDTISSFGNTTAGIQYTGSTGNVFIKSPTTSTDIGFAMPVGIGITSDIKDCYIDNGNFGPLGLTHSTGDISVTASNIYPELYFRNCNFFSTTTLANTNNMIHGGRIASARHNQTSGNHRLFKKFGTMQPDTTIFNTASPSVRMTPNNTVSKLQGGFRKIAVPSGQTATITVYVRKSAAGDGAAYTGNQPRLILFSDAATGVTSDSVLATMTVGTGTWELLTATTPAITDDAVYQVYIDADGTTGWINVDDFKVT